MINWKKLRLIISHNLVFFFKFPNWFWRNSELNYLGVVESLNPLGISLEITGVSQSFIKLWSLPWVLANTMSPFLYIESMSIPRVHVNTISIDHESMSIPWVLVNSMHPCRYHESFPIIWVNVYTLSQEMQNIEINKWQKYTFSEIEK